MGNCNYPVSNRVVHQLPGQSGPSMTKYQRGYMDVLPQKEGAIPRLLLDIAHKRPQNGFIYSAYCFGKMATFELYYPDGVVK